MKIAIGFFRQHLYSCEPSEGGYFPFAIEGESSHVFSINEFYYSNQEKSWIPDWMESLAAFPLYVCTQIPSYLIEDLESIAGRNI
ncbi:hypothetical protein CEF21_06975 [Bacillus sp. FJAT-42376]|uniref:hypothetical protein n=1 Tax=Bacillus sp. FJAT-42376 TaxID=2014076 RepID=UPI000F50049F|nr:hypothetical protein [Bacillus sp. FJAT-42376]AZB42052.1 hypothetical protein CEF21_06975 [Bacillus sp. FJAT-42376]